MMSVLRCWAGVMIRAIVVLSVSIRLTDRLNCLTPFGLARLGGPIPISFSTLMN